MLVGSNPVRCDARAWISSSSPGFSLRIRSVRVVVEAGEGKNDTAGGRGREGSEKFFTRVEVTRALVKSGGVDRVTESPDAHFITVLLALFLPPLRLSRPPQPAVDHVRCFVVCACVCVFLKHP